MIPERKNNVRKMAMNLNIDDIHHTIFETSPSFFWSAKSRSATHPSGPESKSTYQNLSPFIDIGPWVIVPEAPLSCEPIRVPPGTSRTPVGLPVAETRRPTGVEPGLKSPPLPLSKYFPPTHPSGPDWKSTYQYLSPFAYIGPFVITPFAPFGCVPTDAPPGLPSTGVSFFVCTTVPTGESPESNFPPEASRNAPSRTHPSGPD